MEYASKGVAGAALGTGIGGLALGLLNNGGLGNLLGGNNCGCGCGNATFAQPVMTQPVMAQPAYVGHGCCSDNIPINRYELGLQQEIAAKDARIGLFESNIYTDQKLADVYERLNGRIDERIAGVNARLDGAYAQLNQQAVMNATVTANIGCMAQQIAQLQGLTKLVVPNSSVCPGWGNVTITPAAATTTGA